MQFKKKKIVLCIAVAVIFVGMAILVGLCGSLYLSTKQQESLKEHALSDGPWAEQSIWASADRQAYLLSQNKNSEKIADVTAYFYFDEAWHPFRMVLTYGNTLSFLDDKTNSEQFTGDFTIEDFTFTVKNLKATVENGNLPEGNTYVFSKSANYDELISQLPFGA